jgi:hypothetical protein
VVRNFIIFHCDSSLTTIVATTSINGVVVTGVSDIVFVIIHEKSTIREYDMFRTATLS